MSIQELIDLLRELKKLLGEDAQVICQQTDGELLTITEWVAEPEKVILI